MPPCAICSTSGPATERKLHSSGIDTVGQLAQASDALLRNRLGKMASSCAASRAARTRRRVKRYDPLAADVEREVKSYGNGLTAPRDVSDERAAKAYVWMLSESVAQRMREGRARARTVSVGARSADDLSVRSRAAKAARRHQRHARRSPAPRGACCGTWSRSTAAALCAGSTCAHPTSSRPAKARRRRSSTPTRAARGMEALDASVDDLRRRYGNRSVVWARASPTRAPPRSTPRQTTPSTPSASSTREPGGSRERN